MIPSSALESCAMSGIDVPKRERIYLDANIFILAMESRGSLSDLLIELLIADSKEGQAFVSSELTLGELLVGSVKSNNDQLMSTYENVTISNERIEIGPVTREIIRAAAWLRAAAPALKLPDAIHIATAISTRCTRFLTNDTRIPDRFDASVFDALGPMKNPLWFGTLSRLQVIRPSESTVTQLIGIVTDGG